MARKERDMAASGSHRTRVITEDIVKANGDVKYRAGEIKDFPLDVWRSIAQSVGKSLDDFTQPVDEAAVAAVAAQQSKSQKSTPTRERARL